MLGVSILTLFLLFSIGFWRSPDSVVFIFYCLLPASLQPVGSVGHCLSMLLDVTEPIGYETYQLSIQNLKASKSPPMHRLNVIVNT